MICAGDSTCDDALNLWMVRDRAESVVYAQDAMPRCANCTAQAQQQPLQFVVWDVIVSGQRSGRDRVLGDKIPRLSHDSHGSLITSVGGIGPRDQPMVRKNHAVVMREVTDDLAQLETWAHPLHVRESIT